MKKMMALVLSILVLLAGFTTAMAVNVNEYLSQVGTNI